MDKSSLLEKAITIAVNAHQGQKDRIGEPYIFHVLRVMDKGESIDERIVGALHDLVEDTEWTAEQLLKEGFPKDIVEAVTCLTKGDKEPYEDYIERVKPNPLAVKVKLNDLKDNMDLRRLHTILDIDKDRYNRYIKAYHYLNEGKGSRS